MICKRTLACSLLTASPAHSPWLTALRPLPAQVPEQSEPASSPLCCSMFLCGTTALHRGQCRAVARHASVRQADPPGLEPWASYFHVGFRSLVCTRGIMVSGRAAVRLNQCVWSTHLPPGKRSGNADDLVEWPPTPQIKSKFLIAPRSFTCSRGLVCCHLSLRLQ